MGTPVGHDELRRVLDSISQSDNGYYRIGAYLNEHGAWLKTFANDDLYALVQATLPDNGPERTFLLVHAGAGYGAQPHIGLFQSLCTQAWRFEYGGPWATVTKDGLVAFGWRLLIPSDLICAENISDAFGFLLGMVDNLGAVARLVGSELIPSYGGVLFEDSDPDAFPNLLAGVVPPG